MKVIVFLVKSIGFLVGLGATFFVAMALAGPIGYPFEFFMSWPYLVASIGIMGAIFTGLSGWPRFGTLILVASLIVVAIAMASPGDITRSKAPPPTAGSSRLIWGNTFGLTGSAIKLSRLAEQAGPSTVLAMGEVKNITKWSLLQEGEGPSIQRDGGLVVQGCANASRALRNNGGFGENSYVRPFALRVECPNYVLYAVHLTNPLGNRGLRYERRGAELETLAKALNTETGPLVVIGDFNTPPNAPPMADFIEQANINKTSCGGRWLPTWRPTGWREKFPDGNPLTGIPIDHLFTRDIDVLSCTVGADFGSDHLPLVVELQKQKEKAAP